jgi:hypothetical protein
MCRANYEICSELEVGRMAKFMRKNLTTPNIYTLGELGVEYMFFPNFPTDVNDPKHIEWLRGHPNEYIEIKDEPIPEPVEESKKVEEKKVETRKRK